MKKSALPLALSLLGLTLPGCPVYDSGDYGCYSDFDCPTGYVCDGNSLACVNVQGAPACSRPSDCGDTETCSSSGICEVASCHFASVGCVRGYECSSDSGAWQCEKLGAGAGGTNAGGAGGEANAGSPAMSAGAPGTSSGGAPEPASSAGGAGAGGAG